VGDSGRRHHGPLQDGRPARLLVRRGLAAALADRGPWVCTPWPRLRKSAPPW
jgi:hypothetical protein